MQEWLRLISQHFPGLKTDPIMMFALLAYARIPRFIKLSARSEVKMIDTCQPLNTMVTNKHELGEERSTLIVTCVIGKAEPLDYTANQMETCWNASKVYPIR